MSGTRDVTKVLAQLQFVRQEFTNIAVASTQAITALNNAAVLLTDIDARTGRKDPTKRKTDQ